MAFEGLAEENNDLFDLLSHYKWLPVDDDKDELLFDEDKVELMSIVVKLEKNQWNN
jgi:hypothetical protein